MPLRNIFTYSYIYFMTRYVAWFMCDERKAVGVVRSSVDVSRNHFAVVSASSSACLSALMDRSDTRRNLSNMCSRCRDTSENRYSGKVQERGGAAAKREHLCKRQ